MPLTTILAITLLNIAMPYSPRLVSSLLLVWYMVVRLRLDSCLLVMPPPLFTPRPLALTHPHKRTPSRSHP